MSKLEDLNCFCRHFVVTTYRTLPTFEYPSWTGILWMGSTPPAGWRAWGVVLLLGLTAPFVAAGSSRPRAEILHEIQQLLQQDNLTQAENQVAEALKEFPRDAAFYDLLGVVEAKKGNHQSAESAFLKAIDLDPLLTGAYLNLGHLYQEKGAVDRDAPQKALATYGKLLR